MKPRPPHLHHERARSRRVWYVRVGKGKRVRLYAAYGSAEFWREYHDAVAQVLPSGKRTKPLTHSLGWLIAQYRQSAAWGALAFTTRGQRESFLKSIEQEYGRESIDALTKGTVVRSMDKRRQTPEAANLLLKTLRSLFSWALDADLVKVDPTVGVNKIAVKTAGHVPWTAEDLAAFRSRWAIGTKERLAFEIMANTGLRRGDAVKLGRQHIKDGLISITTGKTGSPVFVPVNAELQAALDAAPKDALVFITGANGGPMNAPAFGVWFTKACLAAGVDKTAHGLRKADAVAVAEAGASEHELMARFGWSSQQMASLYTKAASRKRLALEAGRKREQGLPARSENAPHAKK